MKIVFLDAKSIGDDIDLSGFDQLGEVVKYGFSTPEEAGERTKDADVVIINKVQINEQTIGRADHLKLVCVTATGTNNLDKEYLAKRQIEWRNVAGYSTETVAQHTFALLFYLLEKLNYYDQYVKSEKYIGDTIFTHFSNVFHDLNGMTWGIVGLGNIGRRVADIAKMPHLLIAGATGSGKSVCINTLIMSILYKADPNEVKLIMIDPKVVELSVYNGIPHLLIPVVTDPKKAAGALNWAVGEMSRRYQAFAKYNVRDMKGYNEKIKSLGVQTEEGDKLEPMPQIIIIVDELADLMMVAPGDVEEAICRLAQLARAAGIHLVLATQRPSVNVITGLIKANMPSRIAFSVSSGVDSRTIIDMNGAEKLLGKGDMLFYPSGYQKPARVQGSFVTDKEVQQVVEYLREHNGDVTYNQDIETHMNTIPTGNPASGSGGSEGNENDAYFADAGRLIIEKEKASIGMLQRAFKIGFNRAARIMDQLCEAGAVGPEEGTKPRKVLMSSEEFEQYLNEKNG